MKRYGSIYLITNKITGKKYVGQTTQSVKARWRQHCWDKRSGRHLYSSISFYGRDSFCVNELVSCFNQKDLDYMETLYIESLNTFSPDGYNLCKGGAKKGVISDSTREKMKLAKLGKRAKNSGWNNASKVQFSRLQGGRPIVAVSEIDGTIKEYDYINAACKDGFRNSEIYRVLKGERPRHKNHKFFYQEDYANQSGSVSSNELSHAQRIGIETDESE
jgi:hypothetical protein